MVYFYNFKIDNLNLCLQDTTKFNHEQAKIK